MRGDTLLNARRNIQHLRTKGRHPLALENDSLYQVEQAVTLAYLFEDIQQHGSRKQKT